METLLLVALSYPALPSNTSLLLPPLLAPQALNLGWRLQINFLL